MPLFELAKEGPIPFVRVKSGPDLYESEIEELLWTDLEGFLGETLFPVARQPKIASGGIPDILALDKAGRVFVIEIKRDVDRKQLAQCMEYAGWARLTNLDELAGLYHAGSEQFWSDWLEFTESEAPVLVNPSPVLRLVARDFEDRSESAFDYLLESGVPVKLVRVTFYTDGERRIVNVDSDHEPDLPGLPVKVGPATHKIHGRQVKIEDLVEHGYLQPGDRLVWRRPQIGEEHWGTITEEAQIRLDSGEVHWSPSGAAKAAADVAAVDGWSSWRKEASNEKLTELRRRLVEEAVHS